MELLEFKYENQVIRGSLHTHESKRLVLMVHGFTGNKIDHHRFAVSLANRYNEHGFNVLRFDFLGNGESDGSEKDYTPQSEIAQLQFLIDILSNHYDEIILHGFSFGGMVASQVAALNNDKIKKLVLLNPAGNMPEILDDFLSQSKRVESGYDFMGYYFSDDLIKTIHDFDTYKGIDQYQGDTYIIQASADEFVSQEAFSKYKAIYKDNVQAYSLEACDHCFRGLDQTSLLFETMDKVMEELQ